MTTQSYGIAALAAVILSGSGSSVQAQSAPPAAQHLVIVGAVKHVDSPNKITFTGDDGRDYALDLTQTRTAVATGVRADLTPGTRVYVSGMQGPNHSILVSRFRILPTAPLSAPTTPLPADLPDVTVRGTVETVDLEHGAFVLRVNTHIRTVYVTADTDTSGLPTAVPGRFPVEPGGRVTVGGARQPDGTLLAGVLTAKEDLFYQTPAELPNRVLLGAVSSPADKLRRRDIKIRLADGTETKISVPRGIPIRRAGQQISVYDLTRRDSLRITGRLVGSDFRAFRIEVLAPPPDPNAPSEPVVPQSRPGL